MAAVPPQGSGAAKISEPIEYAPSTPAATHYNRAEPPPATLSALDQAVIAAVLEEAARAKIPAPAVDARLFRTCAELAQVVPENGVVPYHVVEFATQRHGIIEPYPHLLVVWGSLSEPAAIVAQLRPRFAEMFARGAPARLGVGQAVRTDNGEGAVVFALQASAVTITPIPRALPQGGSALITGKVEAPYRDIGVLVTDPSDQTESLPMTPELPAGEFKVELSCAGRRGRQQLEISAADHLGTTILANFPVWCGAEPPSSISVVPDADPAPATAGEAERRLFDRVNAERAHFGLPRLQWDELAARSARSHSEEMRRTQQVMGTSPSTGTGADRLRAVGRKSALALQNVARAYGVVEVHAGMMGTPSTNKAILSRAATHVGIGVVLGEQNGGRRELFVTEVFTRDNPKVDEAKAAEQLYALLSPDGKLPRVPEFDSVAQRVAKSLATGTPRERAWDPLAGELRALRKTYPKLGTIITAAADLSMLDLKAMVPGVVRGLGLGLAQGPHPEQGDGALWIVFVLDADGIGDPGVVAPTVLESNRISGQKIIPPDDETKVEMAQAGKTKLVAAYKLCIDTAGAVTVLQMLKPSGFPTYDAKLQREMRLWRYTPFTVDGVAKPVCTSVTFIYQQRN